MDGEKEINGSNGDKDNETPAAEKKGDNARKEGISLYHKDEGNRNGDDNNKVNKGSIGQGENEGAKKDADIDEVGSFYLGGDKIQWFT